ncbi:hypothetical protein [Anoxybacteroides amylolyticum]|nr:hypothetical protein [Anoxybacillus amylolyticus]
MFGGINPTPSIAATPNAPTLHVKHEVRGKDVFVECVIDRFSFTKGVQRKKGGEGHIDVYVNGQKVTEVFTAAFVVRGLPPGKHVMRLELVHNDATKYGIFHEFEVNIS